MARARSQTSWLLPPTPKFGFFLALLRTSERNSLPRLSCVRIAPLAPRLEWACPQPSRLSQSSPLLAGCSCRAADIDSAAGLLHLREFQSFFVFATPSVQSALQKENRVFRVLDRADPPVKWVRLSSKGRLGCHLEEESGSTPEFLCTTVPMGVVIPIT